MKRIIFIFLLCLFAFITSIEASLPLQGKLIILDIGHGSKDNGTSNDNIYEKDINLSVGKKLEKELIRNGASVIMTRDDDYDLSKPNASRRKKSDFDNRIKLINESNGNMYISLHTNYLNDPSYSGAQVFYYGDNNKTLAENIQINLNNITYPREVKKMPNLYMYRKLKIPGVLIELGFLSNSYERNMLITEEYQEELANMITKGIIEYYNK